MSVFEKLFKKKSEKKQVDHYFEMLDGYSPVFTTHDGGIYEMELTRACIHTFANHASKLLPTVSGADIRDLQRILNTKPNFLMTAAQFLYKTATIYDAKNTCFIVPLLDKNDRTIGFYPVNPQMVEVLSVNGEPFLRYTFGNGRKAAIELNRCGIVSKFLYNSDIKGENNNVLNSTIQLIDMQNKGITQGIKNGASFRFMATMGNFITDDDLAAERDRFSEKNFGADKNGVIIFPNTYTNIQQINSQPKIVDPEQMKIIENRVYNYFGSNEKILQNKAVGDEWAAYYEGKIEPFAIQLSQAMSAMSYSSYEISRDNGITWSSNRLQYMTAKDQIDIISSLFDRGLLTQNMGFDILNMPHIEDGDKFYIRRDYIKIDELEKVEEE